MGVITKDKETQQSDPVQDEAESQRQSEAEQTRQSESESLGLPLLLEGTRVRAEVDGKQRVAVITSIQFASVEDQIQFQTPNHPHRFFVKPEYYVITTRDSRNEVLYVKPEDVVAGDEGWARGMG